MSAPQSDDPTLQLWHRVRRPVLGLVFLIVSLGQVPRLFSGDLFPTVTGLLLIVFGGWLIWRPVLPPGDRTSAVYWRRMNRANVRWWALWLVVAAAWLTWGSVQLGFTPRGLIVLAVPSLGLLLSAFGYTKAERIAEVHARNEANGRR